MNSLLGMTRWNRSSRNHSVGNGERARLGGIQPAPTPAGGEAPTRTNRFEFMVAPSVAGQAPARAPAAGALPNLITLLVSLVVTNTSVFAADETPPATDKAKAAAEAPAKAAAEEKPAETTPEYRNWITTSVGGFFLNGDKAQFQRRSGLPGGAFGGVEDFHWEQDVGKKGLFELDGRGVFDNHDYSLKLELSHPEIGFLRGGYREYRTYYDGSGGFFPPNGAWFSIFDEKLSLSRGEAWIEGGLTLADRPEFTFKYSHQFRDGRKDSLSWGDSNLTGGLGTRGIVPSFWDIDEQRDIFSGDLKHHLGNTDFGLGLRYELSATDNARNVRRRPNEPAADRYLTDREGIESDMFNVHAFTETRFNEKVLFTTGYSFTTLDSDISGSRIYGADYDAVYDPVFARRQFRDEGFLDLGGGSQVNQYVMNLNLMLTPWENVAIVPSVRVEKQEQQGFAEFAETVVGAAPTLSTSEEELFNTRERGFVDVSESLEARYTGLRDWSFYVRGEWLEGEGDLKEREMITETGAVNLFRDTDSTRFTQKYIAGANWYPLKRLNFGGQYYHKIRQNDYDHQLDSTKNAPPSTDRYPAYLVGHDFNTDDLNVRATWRPFSKLSLVSRYDFQLSTIDTTADLLAKVQASEMTSHIFSQNITWTPLSRLYLQAGISYALDQTDTPAAEAIPGTNLVLNAKNNYWNANFTAGFALSQKNDLQAQYFYYRANNYVDNSLVGMPYGAGGEEHGITAAFNRRITPKLLWGFKYGFFKNRDATSGGHNDYEAHLVYSSMQYRF